MSQVRHGSDRFSQELVGQPIADEIYRDVFGQDIKIERDPGGELDRKFSVDVVIRPTDAPPITLQEKFLSAEYARFRSITVEYMQNAKASERGDWFKMACQLYFVGYLNEDESDFYPWMLADVARMSIATANGKLRWFTNENKDGHALASFRYVIMDDLPGDCVVDSEL